MPSLLSKIWPRAAKTPPAPVELTAEEKRHAADEAQLAEYEAFDTAVGTHPTQKTAQDRFNEAARYGHARTAEDSLKKGAQIPPEISWYGGGFDFMPGKYTEKPLERAADKEWVDMVYVLLGGCDQANLQEGLHSAEAKKNAVIARAIRDEMARRGDAQPEAAADPMALQSSISVTKPLKI